MFFSKMLNSQALLFRVPTNMRQTNSLGPEQVRESCQLNFLIFTQNSPHQT